MLYKKETFLSGWVEEENLGSPILNEYVSEVMAKLMKYMQSKNGLPLSRHMDENFSRKKYLVEFLGR